MKLLKNILWVLCAVLFASCDIGADREVCNYRVQLRYDYNEENTSKGRNMILHYISHLDELIFDEEGVLVQMRRITPEQCREYMDSEITLPPGRYSVIALGNIDDRSLLHDDANGNLKVGTTRREDVHLSLENAEQLADEHHNNGEKLYHGYRTFTIRDEGISRIRVNMINAHMELRFRVTWKRNTPSRTDSYYAVLESVPSEYNLMPEYIYHAGSVNAVLHEPTSHDVYPHSDNNVIHHIPHTTHGGNNVLIHRLDTRIDGDGEMAGSFTSYRIREETRPTLKIFRSGATRGEDDDQLLKTIDLQEYLDWQGYESPTTTLRQYYDLDIEVQSDGTMKITSIDVADWSDGGSI